MDLAALAAEATELRREILQALYDCGGGHYGGTLSVLDLLLTLYRCQLRVFPDRPEDPLRDRLILSKGHAALALYAVQRRLGFYHHPLAGYGTAASPLEGHPDVAELPEVEFSTGSLGQGLSVGVGMALALREQQPEASPASPPQVWVVLGDGECQEGQVWEAAMLAARLGLTNLAAVVDANGYQEYGWAPQGDPCPVPDLPAKLRAFGWRVTEVDGHDHGSLAQVFDQITASAEEPGAGRPAAVVAHTVKGKGVPLAEADPLRFHCTTVTPEEHHRMLAGLL